MPSSRFTIFHTYAYNTPLLLFLIKLLQSIFQAVVNCHASRLHLFLAVDKFFFLLFVKFVLVALLRAPFQLLPAANLEILAFTFKAAYLPTGTLCSCWVIVLLDSLIRNLNLCIYLLLLPLHCMFWLKNLISDAT
jgi:hypothetical protein